MEAAIGRRTKALFLRSDDESTQMNKQSVSRLQRHLKLATRSSTRHEMPRSPPAKLVARASKMRLLGTLETANPSGTEFARSLAASMQASPLSVSSRKKTMFRCLMLRAWTLQLPTNKISGRSDKPSRKEPRRKKRGSEQRRLNEKKSANARKRRRRKNGNRPRPKRRENATRRMRPNDARLLRKHGSRKRSDVSRRKSGRRKRRRSARGRTLSVSGKRRKRGDWRKLVSDEKRRKESGSNSSSVRQLKPLGANAMRTSARNGNGVSALNERSLNESARLAKPNSAACEKSKRKPAWTSCHR
jgi:hypothetical protein